MLSKATYITIKAGIKDGLYKSIRLVKKDPEGDQYLVGFNRIKNDGLQNTLGRLDYFKKLLDKTLDPGKYEIQASGNLIKGMIEKFPVEILEKKMTAISDNNNKNIEEHTSPFEILENEDFMDIEEYKKLLRDNATLSAQVTTLTLERDWYMKQLASKDKDQGMADNSGVGKMLAELAKDTVPGLLNLTQELLTIRKKEAENRSTKREGKIKIKKPSDNVRQINPEQVINYYYNLLNTNEDQANQELDVLEQKNPTLYQIVSERLWPDGEELEEEEQEEQEEELEEGEEEEEFEEEEEEEEEDEDQTGT